MEKKNLDWSNLGFSYMKTDKRYVANYTAEAGKWDEGALIDDDKIVMSEDAGVLQYSQSVFEGLKAYTTKDGHIVCFRPDLNAQQDPAVLLHGSGQSVQDPVPFFVAITTVVSLEAMQIQEYDHCVLCRLRCHRVQCIMCLLRKPVQTVYACQMISSRHPFFIFAQSLFHLHFENPPPYESSHCNNHTAFIILNYLSANNPQQNDEYDRYQPFFTGAPVKKRSSPHVGNSSFLISVFL